MPKSGWNDEIVVLKKTTLQLYFKTFIEKNQFSQLDYVIELTSTGWNDEIVVLKKTTLQLYFKTVIEKINSGNLIM